MQEAKGWGIQRLPLVGANVWDPTCGAQEALGSSDQLGSGGLALLCRSLSSGDPG